MTFAAKAIMYKKQAANLVAKPVKEAAGCRIRHREGPLLVSYKEARKACQLEMRLAS